MLLMNTKMLSSNTLSYKTDFKRTTTCMHDYVLNTQIETTSTISLWFTARQTACPTLHIHTCTCTSPTGLNWIPQGSCKRKFSVIPTTKAQIKDISCLSYTSQPKKKWKKNVADLPTSPFTLNNHLQFPQYCPNLAKLQL